MKKTSPIGKQQHHTKQDGVDKKGNLINNDQNPASEQLAQAGKREVSHVERRILIKNGLCPSGRNAIIHDQMHHPEHDGAGNGEQDHQLQKHTAPGGQHYRPEWHIINPKPPHGSDPNVIIDWQHPLLHPQLIHKEGFHILEYLKKYTVDLHIPFREQICLECDWSIPSYYRKVRGEVDISNAEFEKICELYFDVLMNALADFYATTSAAPIPASSIYQAKLTFSREGGFNSLFHMHYMLTYISSTVRDEICNQCGWSVPTYYRKSRIGASLSNAHFEKACEVYMDHLKQMCTYFIRVSKGLPPIVNNGDV